jgi:hypothetical protein
MRYDNLFVYDIVMNCKYKIKLFKVIVFLQNLTDFVDSGTDGFIYFSFGTFANISSITRSLKDTFFGAMGSFTNIRFIVKWHEDMSVGLPENIKFVTWAAQQDILGNLRRTVKLNPNEDCLNNEIFWCFRSS